MALPRVAWERPRDRERPLRFADAAWRLVCAMRAGSLWVRDTSLQDAELAALWTPFQGFVYHLLLLACMNVTAFMIIERYKFLTHDHIMNCFTDDPFPTTSPTGQLIRFVEINSHERLWDWMIAMVPMAAEGDPPSIQKVNLLIGYPSLRQVRVRRTRCATESMDIPRKLPLSRWFSPNETDVGDCYGYFYYDTEETTPFGGGQLGMRERSHSEWRYRRNPNAWPYHGYISTYPPHGYWVDLPRDPQGIRELLKRLRKLDWIDRATRAVFLDVNTYNMNMNEICHTVMSFELPPGGGVVPQHDISCTPFIQYTNKDEHRKLATQVMYIVAAILLTLEEITNLCRAGRWMLARYTSVSNVLHLVMLACAWLSVWYSIRFYERVTRALLALQKLGPSAPVRFYLQRHYQIVGTVVLSVAVFLGWLRTFRYHRVTTQVLVTLSRSRYDLLGYFFMYILLHFAFATTGYYLFGGRVGAFKTLSNSGLTILAISLGDFSVNHILDVHWFVAPVFFTVLIFVMVFVFLNMFFVILSYNYDSVREERSTLREGAQFSAFLMNGYRNIRKSLGFPPPRRDSLDELRETLLRCGFRAGCMQVFQTLYLSRNSLHFRTDDAPGATQADLEPIEKAVTEMEGSLTLAKRQLKAIVRRLGSELGQEKGMPVPMPPFSGTS